MSIQRSRELYSCVLPPFRLIADIMKFVATSSLLVASMFTAKSDPQFPEFPPVSSLGSDQLVVTESAYAGYPSLVVPGTTTKGFQYGYSVTQYGYQADTSGKDDNFRGITIFNGTLYVSKGSGSNGINTVFQVGKTGTLPSFASAATTEISILPGFSTALAKGATGTVYYPFGLWFANSTTLYVADEGDGTLGNAALIAGLDYFVERETTFGAAEREPISNEI